METRIYTNGELEIIEYGQRTVYNLNGDIIYRKEGNIIEEIEYSPTGELELYRISAGNGIYQYGQRGEPLLMVYSDKMDETIDKLREFCMYKMRTGSPQDIHDYASSVALDWVTEEEEQRCPNYYDNLNNIFP